MATSPSLELSLFEDLCYIHTSFTNIRGVRFIRSNMTPETPDSPENCKNARLARSIDKTRPGLHDPRHDPADTRATSSTTP